MSRKAPTALLAITLCIVLAGCANVFSDASSVVNNRRVLQDPVILSESTLNIGESMVIPLPDDSAMILWREAYAGVNFTVGASILYPNGSFTPPVNVAQVSTTTVDRFHAAANSHGDLVMVFNDPTLEQVLVARYSMGDQTWGTPVQVNPGLSGSLGIPSIAIDDDGRIMASFVQNVTGDYDIRAAYSEDALTWTIPQVIDNLTLSVSPTTNSATVATGDGFVVAWSQDTGFENFFHARSFDAASGTWGSVYQGENEDGDSAAGIELLPLSGGRVMAIWVGSLAPNKLLAATYDPVAGWSSAEHLDEFVQAPNWVAADIQGGNISVGYHKIAGGGDHTHFVRYSDGAWSSPIDVDAGLGGVTSHVDVVIDSQGGTLVVRRQDASGVFDVLADRFSPSSGFGNTLVFEEQPNPVPAFPPATGLMKNGSVVTTYAVDRGGSIALYARLITLE